MCAIMKGVIPSKGCQKCECAGWIEMNNLGYCVMMENKWQQKDLTNA